MRFREKKGPAALAHGGEDELAIALQSRVRVLQSHAILAHGGEDDLAILLQLAGREL